jgi:hypothetical protein
LFGLDPLTIVAITSITIFYCAYMIGRNEQRKRTELAIEETIMYMVKNNFVKYQRDVTGEIELFRIDENPEN